jgi:DNA-directed RNA polymerase sigma subunit (sigma70/sigma32)
MLPRHEYVVKALAEMNQKDALMLRKRWGMENGKPMQISSLAKYFSLTHEKVTEELRRVEHQVFRRARELEDIQKYAAESPPTNR